MASVKVSPTAAALSYLALRSAADVADHWVQSDYEAQVKGAYDDRTVSYMDGATGDVTVHGTLSGRAACLAHVASYTACQAAAVLVSSRLCGIRLRTPAVAGALALSAATHYWADRRRPLKKLAERAGKTRFYRLGGPRNPASLNGAYCLDQAFHHGVEAVAALVAAIDATNR